MASFLWRNDDLRRLRTRNLVLQGADGAYPAADALLRFVDAEGTVGASGIFVDDSGNLVVTGSADISGGLSVGGSADISGDMVVSGDADICGNLTVGSMTIDTLVLDSLSVTGSVDISGGLTVGGPVDISGGLTVGGPVDISGGLTVDGSVDVSGGLTVDGSVDVSGGLTVDGSGSFGGDLFVGGSVDISGGLTVDGSGSFGGDLFVGGSVDISGGLTVDGSGSFGGDLFVGGSVDISGGLTVDGSGSFGGDLFVGGSVDISGGLTVDGSGSFGGDLFVGGSVDISGGLTVDGSGGFGGNLFVGGSADISGDLYIYGLVSASGDIISSSGLSRLSTNAPNVGSCVIYSDKADGLGPQFQAFKKRGASGAVLENDELCRINFFGLDTSGVYTPAAAAIRSFAAGNFTGTSHPAEIRLATCAVGKTASEDRIIVSANGGVSLLHDSATDIDNKFERTFNDPCGGNVLSTIDYIVGKNDTNFGGSGSYRDYRYVYGPFGNRNVWGIINDTSGGNPGDVEFYQNVSVTGNCIARSLFSVNNAIDATAGASPATASLNTYTYRNIHGYSDKGYVVYDVSMSIPASDATVIPDTSGLPHGLWSIISVPYGTNNERAQPSGIFYWDGITWSGNAVSYNFSSNVPNSAIAPVLGGGQLQVANNGGGSITVLITFRQLLSTPV